MGQKTHPIGFRVGITKDWFSHWFGGKEYADLLQEDLKVRRYLRERLKDAMLSRIVIDRKADQCRITLYTARPGMVIGKKGANVDAVRNELKHLIKAKNVHLDVKEVERPDLDAVIVANNIARQIEERVSFRKAMKKAVANAMRMGAQGIKVACAGRLGGAEIARTEWYKQGRVPLHTLRADIDYARSTAFTISGTVGVKVWIFRGEVQKAKSEKE